MGVKMKYLQHFCLILILLSQFAFAQVAVTTTSISSTPLFDHEQSSMQADVANVQSPHFEQAVTEQDCLNELQQTSCISHCSASVFIPTLTLDLINLSHTPERIDGRFWVSQTAEPSPILFPPIS